MTVPVNDRQKIGAHEIWYEPETEFFGFVHRGVLDATEASSLSDYLFERGGEKPIYFLADARLATGYSPEARKILATGRRSVSRGIGVAVAVFGAPLGVRV